MDQKDLWEQFRKLVGGEVEIRSLREIVTFLLQLVDSPTSTSKDLAAVISADPPMAAKVLSIVNSPTSGVRHKISDLALAISLLGRNQIRDLAMNIAIIDRIGKRQGVLLMHLWKHAFYCGKIAEAIAHEQGRLSGEAFTAGLLHDAGKILLCASNDRAYFATVNDFKYYKGQTRHWQSEQKLLNLNHAQIGALAANHWGLPLRIYKITWMHHAPPRDWEDEEELFLTRVVHVADAITWIVGFPSVDGPNPYADRDLSECVDGAILAAVGLKGSRSREIVHATRQMLARTDSIFEQIRTGDIYTKPAVE